MNIFSILVPKQMLTYLNANDPVDKAVEFVLASGFTAVPVIDDEGRFVAIASEGDFLRRVMDGGRENLANFMVKDIIRMDPDGAVLNTATEEEIYDKILDRNFLAVTDDRGCFVGIITRKTVIMKLHKD